MGAEGSQHGNGGHHGHEVGREVFYAREADGSKATSADRRKEIQKALSQVIKNRHVHGEVLVRMVHESEMAIGHMVPRLAQKVKEQVTTKHQAAGSSTAQHLHCHGCPSHTSRPGPPPLPPDKYY